MSQQDVDALDREINALRHARADRSPAGGLPPGGQQAVGRLPGRPQAGELPPQAGELPPSWLPAGEKPAAGELLSQLAELSPVDWPDRAAGERVLAGISAALGREASAGPGEAGPLLADPAGRPGQASRTTRAPERIPRSWRSRSPVLVTAALAAAAAAAVLVATIPGGPRGPADGGTRGPAAGGVFHSRFAATVLASESAPGPGRAGKHAGEWQLAGYLAMPGWRTHEFTRPADELSCPSAATCYLTAGHPTSRTAAPGSFSILEVSHDGGVSWSALGLPAGISFTTALQCPVSATRCTAAGYDAGQAALLRTEDGGRTWLARRIPRAAYADQLACASDLDCVAISGAPAGPHETFGTFVTRNGGRSWTAGPASPSGQAPDYLACRAATCMLFDQSVTARGSGWTAWFSTDGGLRWRQGTHPGWVRPAASNQLPAPGSASCAGRLHCSAVMTTSSSAAAGNGVVIGTSDGGARWSAEPLPRQFRQRAEPIVISCPTARRCWTAGFYLTSGSSGVPFMLATRDGGVSWRRVVLPEFASSPGVLPTIGLISCPTASRCVAIPFTDPSARRVPVYSLQGPARG
jgi:hypothetical protein